MNDRVVETIDSPDGRERIVILQRPGGLYSFRKQLRVCGDDPADDAGWGSPGPYAPAPQTGERR